MLLDFFDVFESSFTKVFLFDLINLQNNPCNLQPRSQQLFFSFCMRTARRTRTAVPMSKKIQNVLSSRTCSECVVISVNLKKYNLVLRPIWFCGYCLFFFFSKCFYHFRSSRQFFYFFIQIQDTKCQHSLDCAKLGLEVNTNITPQISLSKKQENSIKGRHMRKLAPVIHRS